MWGKNGKRSQVRLWVKSKNPRVVDANIFNSKRSALTAPNTSPPKTQKAVSILSRSDELRAGLPSPLFPYCPLGEY